MRAREFLLEYNRQITANQVGNRLLTAFAQDRGATAYGLANIWTRLRLLANATPEQINAVITPAQRAEMIDKILSAIEEKDPTPNKAYTPWLAKVYAKGGLKMEDMNRRNLLGIYDIGKRRRMIKSEHNDINRFKTYKDFEDTMINQYDLDKIEGGDKKKEEEKGKASKVYEDGNVLVVVPEDEAAACRYGRGTRWCTAATQGKNYFDYYNNQGKMYILIPKKPRHEGEKYQLHFPSGQFMNEEDEEINLYVLLTKRFPELYEFFLQNEPETKDMIIMCPDEELQNYINQIADLAEEYLWEVLSEWEINDEYYYQQMQEKYTDEHGDIDWDKAVENKDDYLNWNDEARRFRIDMNEAIRPTVKTIKGLLSPEFGMDSGDDLSYLPKAISINVGNEFPSKRESDHGMSFYIDRHIGMRKGRDKWAAYRVTK
jgi:hypothetical protein